MGEEPRWQSERKAQRLGAKDKKRHRPSLRCGLKTLLFIFPLLKWKSGGCLYNAKGKAPRQEGGGEWES